MSSGANRTVVARWPALAPRAERGEGRGTRALAHLQRAVSSAHMRKGVVCCRIDVSPLFNMMENEVAYRLIQATSRIKPFAQPNAVTLVQSSLVR